MISINDLLTRRSSSAKKMTSPGPSADELEQILTAAARVPDHGKLNPWFFITFEGDARAEFGKQLRDIYAQNNPDATDKMLNKEEERLLRAPTVVAVISRIRPSTIPQWEQVFSAGAVCYNLCLAAQSLGYGANWLTEWYTFDEKARKALGLDTRDTVAGFIYIGTPTEKLDDRPRPDMEKITNIWTSNMTTLNKGDIYDKEGLPFPDAGFKSPE